VATPTKKKKLSRENRNALIQQKPISVNPIQNNRFNMQIKRCQFKPKHRIKSKTKKVKSQ